MHKASASSKARARVSKDEPLHAPLMLRDASPFLYTRPPRSQAEGLLLGLNGPLTTPPPSKKCTARQDEAWQSCTSDGTGNNNHTEV
jgi:hypothetical protein